MNPIAIKIGSIQIYWYSLILLTAFVIGILLVLLQAKKENIDKEIIYDYAFYLIPICLIGARIYYVLFNLSYYLKDILSIFRIWEGGLAIHGGILAGVIFTYFYTKKKEIPFLKFCDLLVISLILGQVIGRWGNFMNGEAYGPITTFETLKNLHIPKFIIDGMYLQGNYYHPTFFYESLWNFIGLGILIFIRSEKHYRAGFLVSFYLIWYGIGRFLIEGLRQDSLMLGNFRIAQIVSLVMVLIGIIISVRIVKFSHNEIDTKN